MPALPSVPRYQSNINQPNKYTRELPIGNNDDELSLKSFPSSTENGSKNRVQTFPNFRFLPPIFDINTLTPFALLYCTRWV